MIKQQCTQCNKTFTHAERDLEYYRKIGIPNPQLCPQCRFQLRLAYRNERTLYQRECGLCHKPTLAMYSADKPYTVYCHDCFWSDKWNPLDYGRDIDWSKPFFDQFAELRTVVPRLALLNGPESVNSSFTNHVDRLKNCYIVSDAVDDEDCLYCNGICNIRDCLDCSYVTTQSELCYETTFSRQCYNIRYSNNCHNCRDSAWLVDCVGVANSLMCIGLHNQEYCFKNKQLTKTEYERVLAQYQLTSRAAIQNYQQEFEQFTLTVPRKYFRGSNNEASSGDYIYNNNSVQQCFQTNSSEHCSYCFGIADAKDCYDQMVWGEQAELVYFSQATGGQCYKILFGNVVWHGQENYYCDNCMSGAEFCFGSISLKKHKYCILNKEYSEVEFIQLRDRLIKHMKQAGEWGQFFPKQFALFDYNESFAQLFFPLTREQAQQQGWSWQENMPGTFGKETITTIPDDIATVQQSITHEIVACEQCQCNFKYTKEEIAFYKKQGIPLPAQCSECRHKRRLQTSATYDLWQRQCMCTQPDHQHQGRCATQFETTYSPERKELVYCEVCYQKEIY